MPIEFALGTSTLGTVLVARSERGLCAILLGDDPEALTQELVQDLSRRFAATAQPSDDPELASLVAQVVDLLDPPGTKTAPGPLALDLRGTAFQQRVWEGLQAIPAGSTVTYAALTKTLGLPSTAVRAVAQACAANVLAVAVPCHRVVRGDGGLAGYRWGVARKRALLAREEAKRTAGRDAQAELFAR